MGKTTIGIVVGSLRRDSYSKKVAQYLAGLLEADFDVKFLDISDIALYNQDLDNDSGMPEEWRRLRQDVKVADAVLFVTPEYNRSIPGALKNALDVASRPYADNAWSGKPGAVVGVSPGKLGAFGACHQLRQIATCLNILMMQRPETYISEIENATDESGVSDKRTQESLQKFAVSFAAWIGKFTK